MDLVYADHNLVDMGVLSGFTADFAFGRDENNFAVQIPFDFVKGKEPIQDGFFFYVDGTEYGGVVDSITIDTQDELLTYEGRTWRGILADKVVEPVKNVNYKWNFIDLQGDANMVISDVIYYAHAGDLFDVPADEYGQNPLPSEVNIDLYQMRYTSVLTGLMDMMKENNGKLMIKYNSKAKKCLLYAEPLINYAALSDIDSSQTALYVQKLFARVNHIIGIGRWHFEDRFVIHVFGDGNGGVLPYLIDTTKEPIDDDDYILDKSQQKFFGRDEITEVIDEPEIEDVENYRVLTSKPSDWDSNYTDYYQLSEESAGDSYVQLTQNVQDKYVQLTQATAPQDWDSNAENYYYREYDSEDDEYKYVACKATSYEESERLTTKPAKWKKNYKKYYYDDAGEYKSFQPVTYYQEVEVVPSNWSKKYGDYYITDGMGNYSPVSGLSKIKYVPVTEEPSTWEDNWYSYYASYKGKWKQLSQIDTYKSMLKDGKPIKKKHPKFVAKKYYVQQSYSVAPKFSSFLHVYRKVTTAPEWDIVYPLGVFDMKQSQINNSAYQADMFYTYSGEADAGISFDTGVYYKKVYDHYANIVERAVTKLTEDKQNDTMQLKDNVNVEDRWQYDVGDIAGGTEHITGIETAEMVTKKIVHIENGVEEITYEMGGSQS